MSALQVAVAQFAPVPDAAESLRRSEASIREAIDTGARLIVLPEEAMLEAGNVEDRRAVVEQAWPLFRDRVAELARDNDVTIVAGAYRPSGDKRPFNTLLAASPSGTVTYDKLHLYDAFTYRESDYVTPGEELPPVITVDDWRLGLVNCYDIRFPELVRSYAAAGVDGVIVCAAWVAGPLKEDHWQTLVRARAIESTAYVFAASSTGEDCVGLSAIVDPMGLVVALAPERGDAIITHRAERARIEQVRGILPALANRRIGLDMTVMTR